MAHGPTSVKTKKILGDEWQEFRHYRRDWNEDFTKQWKEHPKFLDTFSLNATLSGLSFSYLYSKE